MHNPHRANPSSSSSAQLSEALHLARSLEVEGDFERLGLHLVRSDLDLCALCKDFGIKAPSFVNVTPYAISSTIPRGQGKSPIKRTITLIDLKDIVVELEIAPDVALRLMIEAFTAWHAELNPRSRDEWQSNLLDEIQIRIAKRAKRVEVVQQRELDPKERDMLDEMVVRMRDAEPSETDAVYKECLRGIRDHVATQGRGELPEGVTAEGIEAAVAELVRELAERGEYLVVRHPPGVFDRGRDGLVLAYEDAELGVMHISDDEVKQLASAIVCDGFSFADARECLIDSLRIAFVSKAPLSGKVIATLAFHRRTSEARPE